MPEGDTVRQAAARLRVLEGETLSVEAPHPRAAALGIAPRLDGKRLEHVDVVGKNLLLAFEGGVVLRSHLRLRGRWHVRQPGAAASGLPWLVLRGARHEAVLWHGPVLELGTRGVERLGPDILAQPPDIAGMVARLRRTGRQREIGDALLDQRLVSGIGNLWRAEGLFLAGVSPWLQLGDLDDQGLRRLLEHVAGAMRAGRQERWVYRRTGRPCRRCGTRIASRALGVDARVAYWCPRCQAGTGTASA